MTVHDYIVVGSGCSGAIAAQTLVEAGANVTTLDVGVKNDSAVKIPDKDFLTLRRTDPRQYRYFIGNNADGVSWGKIGTGAQITPPRRFIMNLVNRLTPLQSSTFLSFESLAYGGMGSGWSLQSWEYSKADLLAAGLDYSKMKQAYDYLASTIGVSASNNDATRAVTDSFKNYQPAARMDRNNAYMYKKYLARQKRFNKQGITLGQTPLALLTKNLGGRKKYADTGMGFYSDNGKSAWRPGVTVEQLKKKPNFSYIDGYLVVRFVEKKAFAEVHCLEVATNKQVVFRCRTLVLGTGALASARIVLRSFKNTRTKLPFLSNS
jgi:choline dehydrogenase-like flavoprotein